MLCPSVYSPSRAHYTHTPLPQTTVVDRHTTSLAWPAWSFLVFCPLVNQPSSCHHITSPRIAHRIAAPLRRHLRISTPSAPLTFFSSSSHLDKTIDFFLFCRTDTIRYDSIRLLLCIVGSVSDDDFLISCIHRHLSCLISFGARPGARHDNEGGKVMGEGVQNTTNHTTILQRPGAIAATSICPSSKSRQPAARQLCDAASILRLDCPETRQDKPPLRWEGTSL